MYTYYTNIEYISTELGLLSSFRVEIPLMFTAVKKTHPPLR